MQTKLQEFWDKALELLKTELSGISFETWIKTLEPLAMDETSIIYFKQPISRTDYTPEALENVKGISCVPTAARTLLGWWETSKKFCSDLHQSSRSRQARNP